MYKALVVDDVEAIRLSIAGQVNELPVPVVASGTCENGEKALEWLDAYYSDICITDIRMPIVDGLELIKKIRELYPWMVSMVISSYDDFCYARSSIQLEAVDYILKPVEEENLNIALKKAVEKLEKSRHSKAASLMFSNMSECNSLFEKWLEHIKVLTSSPEELIDETLDRLCKIAGKSYFLLGFLAEEWIGRVSQEMKLTMPDLHLHDDAKSSFVPKPLENLCVKDRFSQECADKLRFAIHAFISMHEESKGSQQSRMMDKIIKYIQENYTRSDLTLQEIADNVLFSKNHTANIFKQETGMTLWNYIIDLRMKKAKELLAGSDVKTLEIAMNVGYNNYNHFSQLFKEYCGISAQEYRKKSQGK